LFPNQPIKFEQSENQSPIEATYKEFGPTTWVCVTKNQKRKRRDKEFSSLLPSDYVAPQMD